VKVQKQKKNVGRFKRGHHQLDLAVGYGYSSKPFRSDEERSEFLLKLYEQMIAEERSKDTLFSNGAKSNKKRK